MKKFIFKSLILIAIFVAGLTFHSCEERMDDPKKEETTKESYKIGSTEYNVDEASKTVTIIDHGDGTGTKTLSSDTTWILDGFVFVNSDQKLTIEEGTTIQGKPGEGENASALIVSRDGKIHAEGTASEPIVFTALGEGHDMLERGLWGGLLILGRAEVNDPASSTHVEGIPQTEPRGKFGPDVGESPDNDDNSGVLKYVSIRHGGSDIGAGNEINGLTLAAVGTGTTVEYIEVLSNKDDGVEWFGGTVNTKYLFTAFCGDDAFDYDMGFKGKGQFWATLQDPNQHNRCGEHDGGHKNETSKPYSKPQLSNVTYIGAGNGKMVTFRDNAGGTYMNSIFVQADAGIQFEIRSDKSSDSYRMLKKGHLNIHNNTFSDVAGNKLPSGEPTTGVIQYYIDNEGGNAEDDIGDVLTQHYNNNNNNIKDLNVHSEFNGGIRVNFVPNQSTGNVSGLSDSFYKNVNYRGAFNPNGDDWADWTFTAKNVDFN